MDWLASDLPIVTHSNGAILVMTMDLKSSSSAMADMDLDGRLLWDLESKVYLVPHNCSFPHHHLAPLELCETCKL